MCRMLLLNLLKSGCHDSSAMLRVSFLSVLRRNAMRPSSELSYVISRCHVRLDYGKAARCRSSRECRRGTAKIMAWYDEVQASATADIANTFNGWVQRPNQLYKGQTFSPKIRVEKGRDPASSPNLFPASASGPSTDGHDASTSLPQLHFLECWGLAAN